MWFMGTVGELTTEQANRAFEGIGHPIGSLIAHILQSEDVLINMFVQHQGPLWEREGWGEKIGGPLLLEQHVDTSRAYACTQEQLDHFATYAKAVFANTESAMDTITDADLDKEANLVSVGFPSNMPLGVFLSQMLLGNTYAHTGEISALKGQLAMKGYPF